MVVKLLVQSWTMMVVVGGCMTKIPPNRGQMVGKAETDEQLNVKLFTFALPPPQWFHHSKEKKSSPKPQTRPPESVMGEK